MRYVWCICMYIGYVLCMYMTILLYMGICVAWIWWFAIGVDIFVLWYYGVVFVYYIVYAFCIVLVDKSILCWKIGTVAIATPDEHIYNCLYINTYLHIDKRRYIIYRYLSIYFCWWWFGSDDRKNLSAKLYYSY